MGSFGRAALFHVKQAGLTESSWASPQAKSKKGLHECWGVPDAGFVPRGTSWTEKASGLDMVPRATEFGPQEIWTRRMGR